MLHKQVFKKNILSKIVKNGCLFKSCNIHCYRSDNSFAQLNNGHYVKLKQFIVDVRSNVEYCVYNFLYVRNNDISNELSSLKEIVTVSNVNCVTKIENLEKLCVYMKVKEKQFIVALPNMFWK